VPDSVRRLALPAGSDAVFSDRRIFEFERYPKQMWKKAGQVAANRAGLPAWAS
jgi:hypothetical protein